MMMQGSLRAIGVGPEACIGLHSQTRPPMPERGGTSSVTVCYKSVAPSSRLLRDNLAAHNREVIQTDDCGTDSNCATPPHSDLDLRRTPSFLSPNHTPPPPVHSIFSSATHDLTFALWDQCVPQWPYSA